MKSSGLILLSALILASCSLQKRHYQKGFFISWHNHSYNAAKEKHISKTIIKREEPVMPALEKMEDKPAAFSANSAKKEPGHHKTRQKLNPPSDSCDILVFRNGSEARIKVIEIGSTRVKYYKCGMPDGPVFISNRSELFMIQYADGKREVFKEEPASAAAPAQQAIPYQRPPKKETKFATLSLTFGILGLYPLVLAGGIIAVITGAIQLSRISANPDAYGGTWKAKLGLIFGIVGIVLWSLVIGSILLFGL